MHRSFLLVWIATFAAFAATDREAAEWVIRKGGRVMLNGSRQSIALLAELPAGPMRLTGVDLTGTVLEPKDLQNLNGMQYVRELYLPGSAFTPGAGSKLEGNTELKAIAGMKDLERLQFSLHFLPYFNVTDAGFASFSGLTNLKELRCEQCKIDKRGLDPFVSLESLDMSYSTFSNNSMAGLENMRNLRRLYLRDTSVTDEGLKHLAGTHQTGRAGSIRREGDGSRHLLFERPERTAKAHPAGCAHHRRKHPRLCRYDASARVESLSGAVSLTPGLARLAGRCMS